MKELISSRLMSEDKAHITTIYYFVLPKINEKKNSEKTNLP